MITVPFTISFRRTPGGVFLFRLKKSATKKQIENIFREDKERKRKKQLKKRNRRRNEEEKLKKSEEMAYKGPRTENATRTLVGNDIEMEDGECDQHVPERSEQEDETTAAMEFERINSSGYGHLLSLD